jgi:hypothetical protein
VSVIGVGSLVLGVVLMVIQWAVSGSWFRDPDVPRGDAVSDGHAVLTKGA